MFEKLQKEKKSMMHQGSLEPAAKMSKAYVDGKFTLVDDQTETNSNLILIFWKFESIG